MRLLISLGFAMALTGCGAEVATTAVTGAAIKKKEVEEGKRMQDSARQKVEQATQQTQQRTEKQE